MVNYEVVRTLEILLGDGPDAQARGLVAGC